MKVLHVTYHRGCAADISFVLDVLEYEHETMYADWNYNIGHHRANDVWNKHKDYFNSFDCVITSDTAPLSRIFLQNGWSKKLIIWVCNRFDYYDAATKDCDFPDPEYYELFKAATNRPNTLVVGYTDFEILYAAQKGIQIKHLIKPTGAGDFSLSGTAVPDTVDKRSTFFIPPYHNDTNLMSLKDKCESLGIKAYNGRYNGPDDLRGFRGIIHIPYAWSNLALFEMLNRGIQYYIPTERFLLELAKSSNFFWTPPLQAGNIKASEWYHPDFEDAFIHFDSWGDLQDKTKEVLYLEDKERLQCIALTHIEKQIDLWREIFASQY